MPQILSRQRDHILLQEDNLRDVGKGLKLLKKKVSIS
jgi:hypothetical protein